ncbi:MAG: DUF2666 family protein [Candidatus Diapherotrites archaeon]|nr:DUF2666 family protein [Candidatus Diapherotrites archaeon]
MDKTIQFIANYDDWVSIKKLKIEPGMEPKTVMEFLASLGTGIDKKVEENLGKTIDLNKLNKEIDEIKTGKTEEEISEALKAVTKRNISAVIKEITSLPDLQKNEIKELEEFCKVYAVKKILKKCELMIDYSEIKIPGMRKTKVK